MNEERCARAAPGKNAGLAPRSPRLPRGHGHAVCMRMHSRTEMTSTAGDTVLPRVEYTGVKNPNFQQTIFWARASGLSHRHAARAGARLSFLLAGVEAASLAHITKKPAREKPAQPSRDAQQLRQSYWEEGAHEELRRDAVHSFRR